MPHAVIPRGARRPVSPAGPSRPRRRRGAPAVLALLVTLSAAFGAGAAPAASTSARQGATACETAWSFTSWSKWNDGTRSRRGWALLSVGNPGNLDESSPAVWSRRDRAFAGVVAREQRGRYRLWVCTVTTAQMGRDRPAMRPFGPPLVLAPKELPVAAFVADRWIAWATTRPGRQGFTLRRQTLGRRHATRRTFRGRLLSLVMARDGTVGVSTLVGGRQRIWRWTPSRHATAMLPPRPIANPKRYWNDAVAIELWDPDSFLLTAPNDRNQTPIAPDRLHTTSRYRPCRDWPRPADDDPRQEVRTVHLRVTLSTSAVWSHRATPDGEGPGTVTRLEACDSAATERLLAVNGGFEANSSDVTYDTLGGVSIVGDAVFATGSSGDGYTGSGSSSSAYDVGFVRREGGWVTVGRHVASPGGAAWLADGQLWVLDAAGTRALGPIPEGFRGLRLRLDGTALDVVATGTTVVALDPVPPELSSFPYRAAPLSPTTTKLIDGTVAAANFGVCSDQHASYCPDPALTP